jgi:type VI protein secretion system component VasK
MQTNLPMNASEFFNLVDHAAGMNDRWLFLAAFCLLLLLCGTVIYWLVKQLQAIIADHKELHQAHVASLTQIIATQNDTTLKLAVCLDRNTEALQNCGEELRRFRERQA